MSCFSLQAYGRSVDWWCLGAVLYEMLYGLPPFYSRDTSAMYDAIMYKPLQFREHIQVSAAAKDLLSGVSFFVIFFFDFLKRHFLMSQARCLELILFDLGIFLSCYRKIVKHVSAAVRLTLMIYASTNFTVIYLGRS